MVQFHTVISPGGTSEFYSSTHTILKPQYEFFQISPLDFPSSFTATLCFQLGYIAS